MNQDNVTEKDFLQDNLNSDSREKPNEEAKIKNKRGFRIIKVKPKSKSSMGQETTFNQCFSGTNFSSQYEDECPVNYSLKYSETESCKGVNKCDMSKKKFKDYSDYAETDLDQPTNFSLKYAEKNYEDENKSATFNYFTGHKVKFKEYTDYVETDLDQPTDFTLKYRESVEEDIKNVDFNYYENEERKSSRDFGSRRIRAEESEDASCERLPERYASSQNETPLMFSRSSSMNSLSSFVHITQSIPDDRSSVVSDFSRMTSGIISPSELPDSPTQTAPSSPKRQKPPAPFPAKPEFLSKQSVFEDDVATYKQEDTPIEFSRATSLSSLNLENPAKSELAMKRSSTSSLVLPKEENRNPVEQIPSEFLKHQMGSEKGEHEKGKFELASVLEVDESLCADCISIDIQINCRKPKPNFGRLVMSQESNAPLRQTNGFSLKPGLRLRFHNENRKGFSGYEGSDDAIHTYHTEGTPANVSHAGSHSDLSALSVASGVPFSVAEDNSDSESLFPEISETVPVVKDEPLDNNMKVFNGSVPVKLSINKGVSRNVFVNNQSQLDYLRKDHQLTAKDETATFATENSPCDFSIRSSFNDLTVNVLDSPLTISRGAACEEPPSQMLSPLHNVSPQSPNSMVFEEAEDAEKCAEEQQNEFESPEAINHTNDEWNSNEAEEESEKNSRKDDSSCTGQGDSPGNFEFDSNQPLTPFEEALLEECIRLGMPRKKNQKQLQETHFRLHEEGKSSEEQNQEGYSFSKSRPKTNRPGKDPQNILNADNFDFDTSEPLTPFEEVLLEQCIRLGMPQKKTPRPDKLEEAELKYLNEGGASGPKESRDSAPSPAPLQHRFVPEPKNVDSEATGLITPLETALLEQCIRLGMPQKKNQKKEGNGPSSDESFKAISCLTAQLNRLKVNSENEKERETAKKCENCPCGKKHNRRKGPSCKKSKNRLDHFKVESCPV